MFSLLQLQGCYECLQIPLAMLPRRGGGGGGGRKEEGEEGGVGGRREMGEGEMGERRGGRQQLYYGEFGSI